MLLIGKRCLPYFYIIFLTKLQALISSVEWLDFYNDSEGVWTFIYFAKFIALVQIVVHVCSYVEQRIQTAVNYLAGKG